jgi:hypothetical protein
MFWLLYGFGRFSEFLFFFLLSAYLYQGGDCEHKVDLSLVVWVDDE